MGVFRDELRRHAVSVASWPSRRWVYVPYDQLAVMGPLADDPAALGVVMVENPAKAARRPYHVQKLAFVLASGRHFALEQARRGVAVDARVAGDDGPDGTGLQRALREAAAIHGPLTVMRPAERELREELAPLLQDGTLVEVAHPGWLTSREDFLAACPRAPFRMDAFYRHVRTARGVLMDGRGPVGGKWSLDAENRKPWRGDPPAPTPPRFTPDAVTLEVGDLVRTRFASHPGALDLPALAVTAKDAERAWAWALEHALPQFGPYEDAMHTRSGGLFHTRIAHLLNVHRLMPERVVRDVLAREELPLACREGFVRQVLGWREFVRHVHEVTDGFRELPARPVPGDDAPLPAAYWGAPSGLACLDHVVGQVLAEGWTHHIPRLMVLANIGTLLGVAPRALTDWFWCGFIDAYDWVVEPNVLAMGTFGVGEVMTTKPYVAGGAYVDRMSDLCAGCAFRPGKDCPLTPMYWAYLRRHATLLRRNPRVAGPVANALARPDGARDDATHAVVRDALLAGEILTPESVARGVAARMGADAPGPLFGARP